jgi:CRISPR-associated endonuclease/helicase Cas3
MELNFDLAFQTLTENNPFPWQQALYKRFAAGDFPSSCNLPTGLGKTSIIAIWLIALKNHPEKVPRRLVYVVNRRTVVDQTTTEVEKLRNSNPNPSMLAFSARMCCSSTTKPTWNPRFKNSSWTSKKNNAKADSVTPSPSA